MKRLFIIVLILCIAIGAWLLYQKSLIQPDYSGLPTVPCIDTTQPIKQSFTLHISIMINGKQYPLDKTIGHDYGKCLHDIYVNNASGLVYIMTNGNEQFTLGNFFDVWHKTYNKNQIFGYLTGPTHTI